MVDITFFYVNINNIKLNNIGIMIFLLAFLGGLLLNLMPCVLPVVSIKIITLTEESKFKTVNTVSYVLGVSFSFLMLSFIAVVAKLMGTELGWGYHMQSPTFVVFLMYVFFLMGINILGGYEININIQGSKKTNMFFYGILTTISSTPCLAPFLGSAIGFAMTQGSLAIILMFQTIALGLSFPYVLLVIFPKILKKLPKSGNWNHLFKEFLSFPLFATSIWLLWVTVTQTNDTVLMVLLSSMLLIYLVVWFMQKTDFKFKIAFFPTITLIIILSVFYVNNTMKTTIIDHNKADIEKVDFSLKKLQHFVSKNRKVFVVVTANWCITCKLNENLFLSNESFQNHLKKNNIIYMVADWTTQNDEITTYMHSLSHSGVPLYVFYGHDKQVRILPTLLSHNILLDNTK